MLRPLLPGATLTLLSRKKNFVFSLPAEPDVNEIVNLAIGLCSGCGSQLLSLCLSGFSRIALMISLIPPSGLFARGVRSQPQAAAWVS